MVREKWTLREAVAKTVGSSDSVSVGGCETGSMAGDQPSNSVFGISSLDDIVPRICHCVSRGSLLS